MGADKMRECRIFFFCLSDTISRLSVRAVQREKQHAQLTFFVKLQATFCHVQDDVVRNVSERRSLTASNLTTVFYRRHRVRCHDVK